MTDPRKSPEGSVPRPSVSLGTRAGQGRAPVCGKVGSGDKDQQSSLH